MMGVQEEMRLKGNKELDDVMKEAERVLKTYGNVSVKKTDDGRYIIKSEKTRTTDSRRVK